MQIIDNKALLLKVREPNRILTVIPRSKLVTENEVMVYWGLEEAQVLKNLGFKDVPSPIDREYVYPGQYPPFSHQKTTAAFLTLHRRAFNFSEQGTGKTASAIWAADYLMKLGQIRRVLVVCPLSIMQPAWYDDIFKFAMHRTVEIAHSSDRKKRIGAVTGDAEFVICNYDGLEIVRDAVKKQAFGLIIVDEANAYKNVSTTRWKTLASIITPSTWVWMMTGTPAAQSPVDAYGLAKIINPGGIPRFLGSFRDMVMQKVSNFRLIPRPGAEKIVHSVLQPAIRFTKEECLNLPEMVYTTRVVPLTAQQTKYYEQLRKHMVTSAAGENITAVNAAIILNKLLQLSGGAVYSDSGETIAFDASNRINTLKEVIAEASHKVIVFVPYTHAIDIIAEELNKSGMQAEIINGKVPITKRVAIFKAFQEKDNPKVLVIQPQAAAHGITLHAANVVVWWGPIMSIETYLQANARVHRAGQYNPCTVVHLQGSAVEKRVYHMLETKVDIHSRVIELYNNTMED